MNNENMINPRLACDGKSCDKCWLKDCETDLLIKFDLFDVSGQVQSWVFSRRPIDSENSDCQPMAITYTN